MSSIYSKLKDIIIIDVEASGSYPIEIGFITSSGKIESNLIRRHHSWLSWDYRAERKVHKISKSMLSSHGISVRNACTWLNESLCGKTVYSDCAQNDNKWLRALFSAGNCGQNFRVLDTNNLMPQYPKRFYNEKFLEFKRKNYKLTQQHRVDSDVLVIKDSLLELAELEEFINEQFN
ncbi:hypothetical protein MIJ3_00023 [Pseudomonas phage vB_PaeM_MIJ3]|nr:hypothetical protein Cassandra_0500 [Pseudomonas phage Cassandra]WPK39688.1 hypothetical protein Deiofobo_0491 [Pseudomonas phage Deifobo]WPK40724.1 hypothetical protein Paride_0494 [Pseudomonas phage Paride]VOH53591.1 hypothetical protein MIJ3_00023 [Pseudomonas phage vB_PaeM_MIJ3]